jgi:photosystem I subunit X
LFEDLKFRRTKLMMVNLLAEAGSIPNTVSWSPSVAIIMGLFTAFGIFIAAKFGAQGAEGNNPKDISPAKIVGGACFGHILGVGVVLGLATTGVL